jgi:hypothetical protein
MPKHAQKKLAKDQQLAHISKGIDHMAVTLDYLYEVVRSSLCGPEKKEPAAEKPAEKSTASNP